MDKRYRLMFVGCGALLAAGIGVAAGIVRPTTGSWFHLFFSTFLLPILAVAAFGSAGVRRIVLGPSVDQTASQHGWMAAWIFVSLAFAVAFACLMAVVVAVLVIDPSLVAAFAEALVTLVAVHISLRLLVAFVANVEVLKRNRR
ncbi:hypothetical protein LZ518_10325 [Sphingomonas sp. RB56-2]|uniref:DUF2975 domain-containing protein n=1 Tax=Sphingomonas brevis TaxID=2908206 RepID=A0ABT0SAW8_9SPHN|nr:hypothetical protein [Sphingomonas brevis]MCL6741528.1 hypothetical protein [Sphingomonas brevis]